MNDYMKQLWQEPVETGFKGNKQTHKARKQTVKVAQFAEVSLN